MYKVNKIQKKKIHVLLNYKTEKHMQERKMETHESVNNFKKF